MRRLSLSNKAWLYSFALILGVSLSVTAAPKKRFVVTKPHIDPRAETVELFDGINKGLLDAHLVPHNADGGNVFIENKTDRPLTVKLPKAVAAVQVLKQGARGGGGGGGAAGGAGGGGAAQSMGGGMMGGGMMGGGGMGRGGGGMFSVPPEQVAQLAMKSVCLEHGKPDPRSSMTYKLVPLNQYSNDPVLGSMLEQFVAGNIDQKAAQAAAWHLANHMSWQELTAKKTRHLGGTPPSPYFLPAQLKTAQDLVGNAERAARDRPAETKQVQAPSSPGEK